MSTRTAYILSLLVGLLSWGALAAVVYYLSPDSHWNQAMALLLLVVAISATAAPLWGRVHRRLSPESKQPVLRVAFRQGLWSGLFIAILLIFHFVGLLDWILVLVTLMLFALLEAFLQQRYQWRSAKGKGATNASNPTSSTYSMARTTRRRKRK